MQPIVDGAFTRKFKNVKEQKQKVDAIFKIVKDLFFKNQKSLTTKYKLEMAPLKVYRGDLSNQITMKGLK